MRYILGIIIGILLFNIWFFKHFEPVMYLCDDTFGCEEVFYYERVLDKDINTLTLTKLTYENIGLGNNN